MEKLFQTVALVRQIDNAGTRLLLQWYAKKEYWQFVVGERIGSESFRETAIREIGWQLNLDPKRDFIVSNMAQLSMEYVDTLPGDDYAKQIGVSFYLVHIYRSGVREELTADPSNRWVSIAEICKGQTDDNQPIDPRVVYWINKWGVLQPWQQ